MRLQPLASAIFLAAILSFPGVIHAGNESICGNGIQEGGEQCDDGASGSACCSPTCETNPECGCCGLKILGGRSVPIQCFIAHPEQCYGSFVPNATCGESGCQAVAVCGNEVVEPGEQCDDGGTQDGDCCSSTCQLDQAGATCNADFNVCTTDTCDGKGSCHSAPAQPLPKSCGCCEPAVSGRVSNFCSVTDAASCSGQFFANADCTEGGCQGAVCGNGLVEAGESCDTGGSADPSGCCDVDTCQIGVENAACGSCDDGEDNDGDGDADSEDCGCSTLCAQQRFAVVTTFVPSKFKRYALYSGSDVEIGDAPFMTPFPTGGVCVTNGTYRAGNDVGHIAATGSSEFGKGAALDLELQDEEEFDTGSNRVTIVRQRFDSDGDPEKFKSIAPFVGPGVCSQDAMLVCTENSNCGMGNTCNGQLLLDNPLNPNVSRTGAADNYTRCINAQATVASEAAMIGAMAANVAGYLDGTAQLKTSAGTPTVTVNVGAGQQVIYVNRVLIAGKTKLRFVRTAAPNDPPTVLVIRVRRQLRLGGQAEIELVGINPENVIWNAEGTSGGRPKLLRSSKFRGTLLAANRRGVLVGGLVQVNGAVKARRVHLSQGSKIVHVPFKPLLVP